MKILIITPWFSPAFKAGGPITSVRNMVDFPFNGISFFIFTDNREIDRQPLQVKAVNEWIPFNTHTNTYYESSGLIHSRVVKEIRNIRPDVLFIIGIYSLRYTLLPLLFTSKSKIIISARGMLHPPALAKKAFKKKIYLFFFKRIASWKNAYFHATDELEKKHINLVLGSSLNVHVANNFPTTHEFHPIAKEKGLLKLLTVALIGPMKNHLQVLLALKNLTCKIHYDIVGPVYVPEYWDACKEIISQLPGNIKVTFHGALAPDDIFGYLKKAHVFICPSESENFGHALFEALSAGRPLITSHQTPWNNLSLHFAGCNVDTEPMSIGRAINQYAVMDNDEFQASCRSACAYAHQALSLPDIRDAYLQMFSIPGNK